MAFNKMFIMLPVMLAARKLDGEDPNVIFLLRCGYGVVQTVAVLLVLYVYVKANAAASALGDGSFMIYVPPPPQPFADPNATKKTYQEKSLPKHLLSTARSLITSTIFGIIMTVGLHMWKGMIVGLAIQSIMAPFNLMENPLVNAVILKGGFPSGEDGGGSTKGWKEKRLFGEKYREEIEEGDEITDEEGNVIVLKTIESSKTKKNGKGKGGKETKVEKEEKSLEDVLLDTWDLGAEADIQPLMAVLNKTNINYPTKENGWTPIMIMSGLGAKDVGRAMREMKGLGANPEMVDKEGWNALHWAAFHGSAEAAKILLNKDDYDGLTLGLHSVADKEGKTPIMHAKEEGNDDVAKVIEEMKGSCSADDAAGHGDEGLRKRK